jgi:hypothetical protein
MTTHVTLSAAVTPALNARASMIDAVRNMLPAKQAPRQSGLALPIYLGSSVATPEALFREGSEVRYCRPKSSVI